MLTHPSSVLAVLYMEYAMLSSTAARTLFTALKSTTKLKVLYLTYNTITDDVADDIIMGLATNKSLLELGMYDNNFSKETIIKILRALSDNDVLMRLHLERYTHEIREMIRNAEQKINAKRRSRGIKCNLTVYFRGR